MTGNFTEIPEDYEFGQDVTSLSDYESLRITDSTPIPEPKPKLKLAGETIAVNCDIFAISGASKSGKSGYLNMVIAASITDSGICPDGIEQMEVESNEQMHAVIHFDTEQAAHRHQYNVRSILKRTNYTTCPDHFLSYNLRKLPLNEYQDITTGICTAASREHGGIHSVYIDGGADFVADTNDQANSNEVIKYFEELAINFDTVFYIVVHTNPGSDKERGHFGSQLQRKAGGILTIKNDRDNSILEPKMLRYAGRADIPKLLFSFDRDKGYFVGSGTLTETNPEEARKRKKINDANELCQSIFGGQKSYTYQEAIDKIESVTLKSININKAHFTVMKSQQMILQDNEDKRWRMNFEYKLT